MRWFYRLMSEEFGPVTGDQIHELLQSGILALDDEIRPEESASWIRVVDASEFEAFQETLSVAQSLDDLAFEFEDAQVNDRLQMAEPEATGPVTSESQNDIVKFDSPSPPASAPVERKSAAVMQSAADTDSPDLMPAGQVDASEKPASEVPQKNKPVRRKKTKASGDPLLDEIFREISDVGKRGDSAKSESAASSARIRPTTGDTASVSQSRPSAEYSTSLTGQPSTAPSVNASLYSTGNQALSTERRSAPSINSVAAAAAAAIPRPVPRKTSSSFQMPEGKTLGIAGSLLAGVAFIGAVLMGWVPLSLAGSGGELPGTEGAVVACYLEFQSLGAGVPVAQEWASFKNSVETRLSPLLTSAEASSDKAAQAGRKLIEMASCNPLKDAKKLQQMSAELKPLVDQILGEG